MLASAKSSGRASTIDPTTWRCGQPPATGVGTAEACLGVVETSKLTAARRPDGIRAAMSGGVAAAAWLTGSGSAPRLCGGAGEPASARRHHQASSPATVTGVPGISSNAAAGRPRRRSSRQRLRRLRPSPRRRPASGDTSSAAGDTANRADQPGAAPASTTQPPADPSAQAKVNPDAAKQALTAARDSLAQMTQLPAAQALTGEPRAQVSQLISNFNELITTNSRVEGVLRQGRGKPERAPRLAGA